MMRSSSGSCPGQAGALCRIASNRAAVVLPVKGLVPVAISLKGYGPQSRQSRTLSDLFSSEPELTSLEALRVVSPSADGAEFLNRDDEL